MCGAYSLTLSADQLAEEFDVVNFETDLDEMPTYRPTNNVPGITIDPQGKRSLHVYRWGLIPVWAKDEKVKFTFNARSETITELSTFRSSFEKRRCLLPANGFYEWREVPGQKKKEKMCFTMADDRPFAFAGLWSWWKSPEGAEIISATVLTSSPNDIVAQVHDRMPVILQHDDYDIWLEPNSTPHDLRMLLCPYPTDQMKMAVVG